MLPGSISYDRMRLVSVAALSLSLVSCGPKKAPDSTPSGTASDPSMQAGQTAAPPPQPAAPKPVPAPKSPLTLAAVPVPGAPELPPLSGAMQDLDMVSLTKSTQTFTIEADTAMFTATDPRVAARLQQAFEYDPGWRVGLWEQQTVAWVRAADPEGWAAPWGGYSTRDGYTIRALFRFGLRPANHPWTASGLVARNTAGARAMQVVSWRVDRGPWTDQRAAAFTIDGNGMSLEVHEIAPQLALAGTQRELARATLRTKAIADQVARGNLQRTALAMVPPGEPMVGNPFVTVTPGNGSVDVRGRVNPGAAGWTWARILDAERKPWQEAAVAVASAERIGWDTNPDVVSYFQSTIPVQSTPPSRGTLEVWFHPDGSDVLKLVGSFAFPGE